MSDKKTDFSRLPEKPQDTPLREEKAPEYFNPWNMSKKKPSGGKRIYCNSLPEKLPE